MGNKISSKEIAVVEIQRKEICIYRMYPTIAMKKLFRELIKEMNPVSVGTGSMSIRFSQGSPVILEWDGN